MIGQISDTKSHRRLMVDGRKFFSRSPFRSWPFLVMTTSGVVCLGLVALIFLRRRHQEIPVIGALLIVAYYVAGTWWTIWRRLDHLRELYEQAAQTEKAQESTLDTALGIGASIAIEGLFYSFQIIALLLLMVFFTLKFVDGLPLGW